MDPMTWTGNAGIILNPLLLAAAGLYVLSSAASFVFGLAASPATLPNLDGTVRAQVGARGWISLTHKVSATLLVLVLSAYLVAGLVMPWGQAGIIGSVLRRFLPVWGAMAIIVAFSVAYRRNLGLYGRIFDSTVGVVGFTLVLFWICTALAAGLFDMVATHDPLAAVSGLKNKPPGTPLPDAEVLAPGSHYLLGGDNLARDVFSRMVHGSWIVIQVAPLATLVAFMVGVTLGLPAGYHGGRLDVVLSFLANLILAFPVILLFYLLVTPEIIATGIPSVLAMGLFLFPLVFLSVLLWSRFRTNRSKAFALLLPTVAVLSSTLR